MEPKEKKVSIGLLWAIIAIPVFEILRVPLGLFFFLIGQVAQAVLVNPFMWFIDRGIIGAFWSYQIPIVPYAVAIIFKVIAIPVVVIVLFLALIIGAIILLLMMLLVWLDQIHILAWIIAPIFAYYAYMTDFWANQREEIRDRLLQIRAVLVNIVSWFTKFRAVEIKLDNGRTVRYKIKRKYSKAVLTLALLFISIGIIGRSTEFLFTRNKSPTLSYKPSFYLYVDVDTLNIRTHPNSKSSSNILTIARRGQRLEKLGEKNHWYKIRLPDNKIGWVYGDYVSDRRIISKTPKIPPEKKRLINIALGKTVSITTNGVEDSLSYAGSSPSDVTDGSLDYKPASEGVEDGCVSWNNDDYNETMVITITIDLQGTYNISKIRYNPGNCQRAETWNADLMESPFGSIPTNPGSSYRGVWTEQTGSITASKVTIKLEKTRRSYETSWLFIGEIEILGTLIKKLEAEKIQKRRLAAIPAYTFSDAKWDEYGPGYNGGSFKESNEIWGRKIGCVSYTFKVPEIDPEIKQYQITALLSSELENTTAPRSAIQCSSDVTLVINRIEIGTKNIIPDNAEGENYSWTIPASQIKKVENTLTFRVKEGAQYKNGLVIYTRQPIQLRALLEEKKSTVKGVKTLSGLKGEYFNLSQFYRKPLKFPEEPNLSRVDKTIDFNWERGRPDPTISSNYFGVRWTGFVHIPTSGTYKFKVWRDDGCRLWFDNKLILDTWYEGDWDHWIDFEHHFEKTGWHSFKLEFYEIADRARITLKWQPPGKDTFEVIPPSHLKPSAEEIDSTIITMNGREEGGVPTGIILEPGESAKISYISGKIISNTKTGVSVPIWGVPIEKTDPSWIPLMPYAKKGIWTNAVVVFLGPVGTDFVYPFGKDNYEIVVRNTTSGSQEIRLFFHDAKGYFQDNDGDVKFLVRKLPIVTARVSNVDDKAIMYINGQEVITVTWGTGPAGKSIGHRPGNSGWIDITPYLKMEDNVFRFWVWNAAGCCDVSGTFEVEVNGAPAISRNFKRQDSSAGVKYDETMVLTFP